MPSFFHDITIQLNEENILVCNKVKGPPLLAGSLEGTTKHGCLLQLFKSTGLLGVPDEEVHQWLVDNCAKPIGVPTFLLFDRIETAVS